MQDTATINSLSLRIGEAAWNAELPMGLKFVLLAICKHVNNKTGYAYPSIARIARRCSMHTRTVQTHLNKLLAMGLVQAGRLPGLRTNAYRVDEAALDRAQMQPEFDVAMTAKTATSDGPEVQDFSQNHGDLFQKHEEITTQNGNELKEREERGTEQPPPPPPALASLPENQKPQAAAQPTAVPDITAESLDRLNDQRIVNGKPRLGPDDIAKLRTEAAAAGITPQTAVDWLLKKSTRNFFHAEFFRAPAQPVSAPAPAAPAQPAPPAPAAVPVCPQAEAAAASAAAVARAQVSALLASAKAATSHSAKPTTAKAPNHGPQWARDAVAKALAGEYVAHIALRDACAVLGMCPKAVRASAAAAIAA